MEFFKSKLALFTKIDGLSDNLDFTMTMNYKHHFSFQTKSGEYLIATQLPEFIENLNKSFDLGLDPSACSRVGQRGYMMYKQGEKEAEVKPAPVVVPDVEVVQEPVQEESELVVPELVEEEVSSEEVIVEDLVSLEAPEESVSVNWEWVDGLVDTKEDKSQLKTYAKETFGITLKGNLKLENLVEKFKEGIEAL